MYGGKKKRLQTLTNDKITYYYNDDGKQKNSPERPVNEHENADTETNMTSWTLKNLERRSRSRQCYNTTTMINIIIIIIFVNRPRATHGRPRSVNVFRSNGRVSLAVVVRVSECILTEHDAQYAVTARTTIVLRTKHVIVERRRRVHHTTLRDIETRHCRHQLLLLLQ